MKGHSIIWVPFFDLEFKRESFMEGNKTAFEKVAETLLSEYLRVYYVDTVTNGYYRFSSDDAANLLDLETSGPDFFGRIKTTSVTDIHEEDRDAMMEFLDKDRLLAAVETGETQNIIYRLMVGGKALYHCMIVKKGKSDDSRFFVCGVLNIDREHRDKLDAEEMQKKLLDANRMARRDELTGIRNKNAYRELEAELDKKLHYGTMDGGVAIVVCDMNDLKLINDTKGHTIGDDYLRKASFLICETFNHSPVFRVGGDEFVAVLMDRDYIDREYLVSKFKSETVKIGRERSGPFVACGMSECNFDTDTVIADVFKRADKAMYEDKEHLKALKQRDGFYNMTEEHTPVPDERKRMLNELFNAIYSLVNGGYVYLLDIKYDFSRWSPDLVKDYNMQNEYLYSAGAVWEAHIHPDDMPTYKRALDGIFFDNTGVRQIHYRVCNRAGDYIRCYTRGFVMNDENGEPDFFGGIIVPEE